MEDSAVYNSFHAAWHSQPRPCLPPLPLLVPISEGSHLLLLGGSYFLSTLPTTPTQPLSQSISCSFPSDQFLRKLIIHRGRRRESLRAKNREETSSPFFTFQDNLGVTLTHRARPLLKCLQFPVHSTSVFYTDSEATLN